MIARSAASLAALALALAAAPAVGQPGAPSQALEQSFDALISSNDQLGWLQQMSSEPNHVGSPHDKANAELIARPVQAMGLGRAYREIRRPLSNADHETLELMRRPARRSRRAARAAGRRATRARTHGKARCRLMSPIRATATSPRRSSTSITACPRITRRSSALAFRQGQDRHRPLRRRLARPQAQARAGTRRGRLPSSIPTRATTATATATSIPRAPHGRRNGVQRGSVADMTIYPGDPLTPGIGATRDAKRLTREDAPTILKIPALPISYADAQDLDRAGRPGRTGQAARRAADHLPLWRHRRGEGASRGQVRLVVEARSMTSSRRIRGSTYPDQWIVRGNHRDGWVFGAADPLTGQVALMGEAKALGALTGRAGGPSGPSSTRAGTPRSQACSARPNGPRRMPTS